MKKYIVPYKNIKEGVVDNFRIKTSELLNIRTLKENDKIAKKWINKIKSDFNSKENYYAFKLIKNDYSNELVYVIFNGECNDAGWGNRSSGDYDIKITFLKEKWDNDISGGRLEVTKFIPYRGTLEVIGRDMKTNKTIENDNGISNNYSYINISGSLAKNIYDFFRNKADNKYPLLKGSKYFNSNEIYRKYPEIAEEHRLSNETKWQAHRKKQEEEHNRSMGIFNSAKFETTSDDIEDMFVELLDEVDNIHIHTKNFVGFEGNLIDKYGIKNNVDGLEDGRYWIIYMGIVEGDEEDIYDEEEEEIEYKSFDWFCKIVLSKRMDSLYELIGYSSYINYISNILDSKINKFDLRLGYPGRRQVAILLKEK